MSRLSTEFQRLYLPTASPEGVPVPPTATSLVDADGRVRALVIERTGPAAWEDLSAVWRGVQETLDWPAPAIAVSGTDALQLWFSLESPVPLERALAAVERLRQRFVPDAPPARFRLWPAGARAEDAGAQRLPHLPGQEVLPGQWAAFVAPDLAPVFSETPWLDIPPGEDGQAGLLGTLRSIGNAAFDRAFEETTGSASEGTSQGLPATSPAAMHSPRTARAHDEARQFLLDVMNDERVAMALRIEAAKALLAQGTAR